MQRFYRLYWKKNKIKVLSLCVPCLYPEQDSLPLGNSHVGLFKGRKTGRGGSSGSGGGLLCAPLLLCFGSCGWLPLAPPPSRNWPRRCGWRGGSGADVWQVVGLVAEGTGAAEGVAQRPPLLLTLTTQAPAHPEPDVIAALQQEVHQLHVWPAHTHTHTHTA